MNLLFYYESVSATIDVTYGRAFELYPESEEAWATDLEKRKISAHRLYFDALGDVADSIVREALAR